MDDKNQREKLEQELSFLKESFDAEVISKEEFEKGRNRVEAKLKEINQSKNGNSDGQKQSEEKQEPEKTDQAISANNEEKIKLRVIQDEDGEHDHYEPVKLNIAKSSNSDKVLIEEKRPESDGQKKESKFFKYAVVFLVLALIIFFSYSLLKADKDVTAKTGELKFIAACSSNNDCSREGNIGTCLEPGTKSARCEFRSIVKTRVLVLNDRKNCFNCDSQRVLGILEGWFGPLDSREIDYNTSEGKKLAETIDAKLLPTYILDENITKKPAFEQYSQAFSKKNNNFVLSDNAAGSTLYFRRENVPNNLDLFVISGDSASAKAENNLKEFLDNFKVAKFEKHSSNDQIAHELGIKTFPAFLVNNRVRFSGIQTAETIKEDYCSLNQDESCKKILSKNLI